MIIDLARSDVRVDCTYLVIIMLICHNSHYLTGVTCCLQVDEAQKYLQTQDSNSIRGSIQFVSGTPPCVKFPAKACRLECSVDKPACASPKLAHCALVLMFSHAGDYFTFKTDSPWVDVGYDFT